MTRPVQNAEKLPATNPDKILSDAPPCRDALVTSATCRELVLVKIFVNSGINAPANVPQLIITDSTHHKSLEPLKSPSNILLATNVTPIETSDVIQTRFVSGCSKSNSFLSPHNDLLRILLIS